MTDAPATTDETCPDAIIAGTLCLMSCYAQHQVPSFAGRIADNLLRLASMPTLTAEFRAVCRRMAARWIALRAEAMRLSERGIAPPDTRLLQ